MRFVANYNSSNEDVVLVPIKTSGLPQIYHHGRFLTVSISNHGYPLDMMIDAQRM